MERLFNTLILLILSIYCHSQIEISTPKIIPTSPNAASLGIFGDIPVGHYVADLVDDAVGKRGNVHAVIDRDVQLERDAAVIGERGVDALGHGFAAHAFFAHC